MPKGEREEVLQYLIGFIVDSYIDINHCLSEGDTDPNNSNGEICENDYEDDDNVEVSGSEDDEKKCNSEDDETIEETIVSEQDNIAKSRWIKDKDDDYV